MPQSLNRNRNLYGQAMHQLNWTFAQVWVFSAIINVLMLTGPIYMLQVYDRVLSSGSVATLQGLFIIAFVLYIFLGVYEFLRARILSRAGYRLDATLGDKAVNFWLRTGVVRDRDGHNPVRDLDMVRGFLSSPAVLGLFDLPWIPLFLGVVFFIHPWLGYLTIVGAGVVAVVALINQRITRQPIAESMAMDSAERAFIERSRRNAESVFALGMQDKVVSRWRMLHSLALRKSQQGGDRSEGISAFSKAFRLLLQSALLTLGAYLAIRQEVSPGAIIATSIIAGRALAPVDQVIGNWRSIGRAREANRRLREAFALIPAERALVRLPEPKGDFQVSRLTKMAPARASGAERTKILDRINFSLEPGDGLGVIGTSAAGKSSLAKVLVGVWKPDLGEVRLDGATLDQWHPEDLGRHVGYLPQSVEMLPGTIAENIARFDPKAKDRDIIEAATIAGIHEMILTLPEGYGARIGNIDQPLSGGQIQRIGLARAIYGMPRLVVLDEPNSNLDSDGDDALSEAIKMLRDRGCVVIVMAHRPSAIASVNKVMILHKGAVARFGEKDEIMRQAMRPTSQKAG
ncbi:type I secretion system permease/ATPase [Phaeovulum sp.]|uniref:type I secretion system permease/ATPase n=1 Tax=Phaeovulum sp. TaxID=2934796 RepID=UPI0039E36FD5